MDKWIKMNKRELKSIKLVLFLFSIITIILLYFLVSFQTEKVERSKVAMIGTLINDYNMDQRDALNIVKQEFNQKNYDSASCLVNDIVNYQETKIDYFIFIVISGAISIIMISMYLLYKKQMMLQDNKLQRLIEDSEYILAGNKEHLDVIDGEDRISILSSKLYILNERYYTVVKNIMNEKIKLKEYIEDITHQIKTPITSMRLNEELLLNTSLSDKQRTKVEYIYDQTTKITDLVDALLRLAKVESRSVQFVFAKESVLTLLSEVENVLEPLLLKQQVTLHIEGKDSILDCDHAWMVEALENIIKNSIEVKAHDVINIKVEENEFFIYIIIQDHGPGFNEEDLDYIFDRFYRIDKTNTIGVGIGLALTKEIIALHHGTIAASNNNGACFTITLPKIKTKDKYVVTK